jgi:hypothetical protein
MIFRRVRNRVNSTSETCRRVVVVSSLNIAEQDGMNSMKRWAFSTLSQISLLLFVATAWLWTRSYWNVDEAYAHLAGSKWDIYVVPYPGQWFVQIGYDEEVRAEEEHFGSHTYRLGPNGFPVAVEEGVRPANPTWAGFALYWDYVPESSQQPLSIKFPQWLLPLVFFILPLWWNR